MNLTPPPPYYYYYYYYYYMQTICTSLQTGNHTNTSLVKVTKF